MKDMMDLKLMKIKNGLARELARMNLTLKHILNGIGKQIY